MVSTAYPPDNPFLDGTDAAFADEVYAYGFKNPNRLSFDRDTGELYLADVGQNDIEEINIVVAGGNYGWNRREGSFGFEPNGDEPGFVTEPDPAVTGLIDPIAEYDHDEGSAYRRWFRHSRFVSRADCRQLSVWGLPGVDCFT